MKPLQTPPPPRLHWSQAPHGDGNGFSEGGGRFLPKFSNYGPTIRSRRGVWDGGWDWGWKIPQFHADTTFPRHTSHLHRITITAAVREGKVALFTINFILVKVEQILYWACVKICVAKLKWKDSLEDVGNLDKSHAKVPHPTVTFKSSCPYL